MFTYFKNAVHNSPQAKQYIQSRSLDFTKLEIGYNAAQFHHGTRKDETLIQQCLQYGLLIDLEGYDKKVIDHYTGALMSFRTMQTAYAVYSAFAPIVAFKYFMLP